MKKKQIVFVNQSSGYLMIDIVNAFRDEYDERILMTGFLNPRNKNLDATVKVEWLAKYKRTSTLKRIVTWLFACTKAYFLIQTKYRNAHLFLVSNPPMATLLPLLCSNSYSLLIYDIYPDALLEFKILKPDSRIIKYWKKANITVFSEAERIFTITDGMKEKLSQYVALDAIEVIPIWTDTDFLKPVEKKENLFLKEQNLENKFVILYSGNLGKSHPIEIMVDIAATLSEHTEIFFLIIGEGDKYEFLRQKIEKLKLENIRLLPWQPTDLLPLTLSGADLAVVSLGKEASDLSIPSKTYNLMSVGVPILCIANKDAALSKLIEHHHNGKVFSASQKGDIQNFILNCQTNPDYLENMKKNSLVASTYYTPENAKLFSNV